jgi:hypothetical protein
MPGFGEAVIILLILAVTVGSLVLLLWVLRRNRRP